MAPADQLHDDATPISRTGRGKDEARYSEHGDGTTNMSSSDGAKGKGRDNGKQTEDQKDNKDDTFAGRLRTSATLTLAALTSAKALAGVVSPGKSTTRAVNDTGPISTELGESSRHSASARQQMGAALGPSLRRATYYQEQDWAFGGFVNHVDATPLNEEHSNVPRLADRPHQDWSRAVEEQQLSDGSAVLQLLSRPDEFDEADQHGDEELSLAEAARLREALFESVDTRIRAIAWDGLLNFRPDFLSRRDGVRLSEAAEAHLGVADVAEAESIWLQQWSDVLSSYNDQVWGELAPLAARAKVEIDGLTSSPVGRGVQEAKALVRLKQILQQLQHL